jgi:hypothetical protein
VPCGVIAGDGDQEHVNEGLKRGSSVLRATGLRSRPPAGAQTTTTSRPNCCDDEVLVRYLVGAHRDSVLISFPLCGGDIVSFVTIELALASRQACALCLGGCGAGKPKGFELLSDDEVKCVFVSARLARVSRAGDDTGVLRVLPRRHGELSLWLWRNRVSLMGRRRHRR